jgi:FtsP/CotA-like multicopper oxidase with cupredoxin domain
MSTLEPTSSTAPPLGPRRRWVAGFAGLLVVGSTSGFAWFRGQPVHARDVSGSADAGDPATRMKAQFSGAYSANSPPAARAHVVPLEARPSEVQLVDGRPTSVWSYNGQVPGPTIRMRLGESLVVPLTNHLPQETTIHWHGVRVPNAMDGAPGVTQAPVQPGETFTYRFVPKDAGTFWFHPHAHSSEQVERGLYGVLIVEDPTPPPYSQDVVWVLDDWRLTRDGQIDPHFNTGHDISHDGRWGNLITVNSRTNEELVVRAGERIRLRLVDVANGRVFAPDFSALNASVIAVDGMYTARPLSATALELATGNRIDLDITIAAEQRGLRFPIFDDFGSAHHHGGHEGRRTPIAWIHVLDEVVATPGFPSPAHAIVPAWSEGLSAAPDLTYTLSAGGHGMGGPMGMGMGPMGMGMGPMGAGMAGGTTWLINGHAFPAHQTEQLPQGRWAKVRFVNTSSRLHPMHVHGQFFKVLARNGQAADEPFWRDTVLVKARETIDIGMMPLDEGKWMLHCHILEHADAGMMTELDVEPPTQ